MPYEHNIFIHKEGKAGATPLSPESPKPQQSGSTSPKKDGKNTVLLGYSALLAKRSVSALSQELRAGGNEQLATQLNNISNIAATAATVVATKGLALIPMAIDGTISAITNTRQTERLNRQRDIQREAMGSRITFNQGRVYSD